MTEPVARSAPSHGLCVHEVLDPGSHVRGGVLLRQSDCLGSLGPSHVSVLAGQRVPQPSRPVPSGGDSYV